MTKPRAALLGFSLFLVISAIGMYFAARMSGESYGNPGMISWIIPMEVVLVLVGVWITKKFFSWEEVGFRQPRWDRARWLFVLYGILIAIWIYGIVVIVGNPPTADQWRLFAIIGATTLLVGVSEELMFRGIVLQGFLTSTSVPKAMFISAVCFSLIHSVNVFAGLPLLAMPFQLIMTLLFGMVFAPIMIRVNSLIPLIIYHWLWDFWTMTSGLLGYQITALPLILLAIYVAIVVVLWREELRKGREMSEKKPGPAAA